MWISQMLSSMSVGNLYDLPGYQIRLFLLDISELAGLFGILGTIVFSPEVNQTLGNVLIGYYPYPGDDSRLGVILLPVYITRCLL